MNKKEYGRPSWDLIVEWTNKDGKGSIGRDEYAYSLAHHAASHAWPEYETAQAMENMSWNYDRSFTQSTLKKCIKSAYKEIGGAA
jgi:type 1 glutamine amidotransferase